MQEAQAIANKEILGAIVLMLIGIAAVLEAAHQAQDIKESWAMTQVRRGLSAGVCAVAVLLWVIL